MFGINWKAIPFTHKDGTPVFRMKKLFTFCGWTVRVHKFTRADDPGCFHSHPAVAYRFILWGGYVEELPSGNRVLWMTGDFGKVTPDFEHRIHRLLNGRSSYSVWIRGPITHDVKYGCVD